MNTTRRQVIAGFAGLVGLASARLMPRKEAVEPIKRLSVGSRIDTWGAVLNTDLVTLSEVQCAIAALEEIPAPDYVPLSPEMWAAFQRLSRDA